MGSKRSKEDILRFLEAVSNDKAKFVSGQNAGHTENIIKNNNHYIEGLAKATGKYPGLMGVDYGFTPDSEKISQLNKTITSYWNAGGLITISFHPDNPITGGNAWDTHFNQFEELTTEGTPGNQVWMKVLSIIADSLEELRDAGVVVLWRPLHEMNGSWFWWCPYDQERGEWLPKETLVKLWVHMYEYFTYQRKLDNLLWVYSPGVSYGTYENKTSFYYPGDEYVDIVALDWYTDSLADLDSCQSYSDLAGLNKPMGIAEFGPRTRRDGSFDNLELINKLCEQEYKVAYFMHWHSWGKPEDYSHVAIMDNLNAYTLMKHPAVITREELW